MGVESLDFKPGSITEISGENAAGKSTVLAALQGLLGKGTDATLIRDGAQSAEVVMLLDDGLEFEKQWTADGKPAKLTVRRDGGPPLPRGQSILDSLFDRLVNPLDFLLGDEAQQQDWIFESIPLKVTAAELAGAIGESGSLVDVEKLASKHALVALDAVHADVYELRRQANVTAIDKRKTQRQLAATLPIDDGEDWRKRSQEADQHAGVLRERIRTAEAIMGALLESAETSADLEFLQAKGLVEQEKAAKIATIEREAADQIATSRRAKDDQITAARAERDQKLGEAKAGIADELRTTEAECTTAQARAAEFVRASTARDLVDRMDREAAALEATWKLRDDSLKNIEALRQRVMEALPIPGLEFKGGKLTRGGIVLRRLNTAQQIELCVDVTELRAGKAGLVLVDGLERLDTKRYNACIERWKTTGLQYICTRVSDEGKLRVQKIA